MKSKIVLLIFLSCFLSSGISAKETLKETSTDSDLQEYMLEEIRVIGKKSLHSLKRQAIRAEDIQFKIFNSLNSTDEFDITCEWRAPTGSRIKERFCDVGYMKKARALDSYLYMTQGIRPRSDLQLVVEFANKYRALKKEMESLTYQHPELATAMIRARELQQRYEAERRERFKDSILIGHPEPDENDVILNEIDIWQIIFLNHSRGAMPDEIWERWDRWCIKKIHEKYYQNLWESANQKKKYADEFIAYINTIISGE